MMKPHFVRLLSIVLLTLITSAAEASRIVVLSSTAWDFIKELGLTADVVGRADNVEAPELAAIPKVGRSDGVNLESVLATRPEVVLGSPQYHAALAGPLAGAKAKLELISIKRWSDVPVQLDKLAQNLGVPLPKERSDALAKRMEEAAARQGTGLSVAVIVNAEPLLVATAGNYSADLIRLAGANADLIPDAPGGQFRGFTQFSDEKLLELNPDVILLSRWRSVDQLDAALATRPFWNQLKAVKNGWVKQIDADQLYTVPGPRAIATVKELGAWFSTLKKP